VNVSFLLDIDFQLVGVGVGVGVGSLLVEDLSNLHHNFNREPLIDLRNGMGWDGSRSYFSLTWPIHPLLIGYKASIQQVFMCHYLAL